MARKIIPKKIIIEFDDDTGTIDGVIQYQIDVDGVRNRKYKTIGIKNAGFNKAQLVTALRRMKRRAEQAEGIGE
jgi:hypothetical protein